MTVYMHSSLRTAAKSIANRLIQWFKKSFAFRCAQVWMWYTSHADGYVPCRTQAKAELGLSDYQITRCLRALERIGLAALDITRARGKVGCWRVFKRPVYTPQPCPDVPPAPPIETYTETDEQAQDLQAPQSVLPPNFLPPNFCPPLSNKRDLSKKYIKPSPKSPEPVYTEQEQSGAMDVITDFVDNYPKPSTPEQRAHAIRNLRNAKKAMGAVKFEHSLIILCVDIANRVKNDQNWRASEFRPNVARYISESLWLKPITPYSVKTPCKPISGHTKTTRDMTLADELSDHSWAAGAA